MITEKPAENPLGKISELNELISRRYNDQVGRVTTTDVAGLNAYELWALFLAAKVSQSVSELGAAAGPLDAECRAAWRALGPEQAKALLGKLEPMAVDSASTTLDDVVRSAMREMTERSTARPEPVATVASIAPLRRASTFDGTPRVRYLWPAALFVAVAAASGQHVGGMVFFGLLALLYVCFAFIPAKRPQAGGSAWLNGMAANSQRRGQQRTDQAES